MQKQIKNKWHLKWIKKYTFFFVYCIKKKTSLIFTSDYQWTIYNIHITNYLSTGIF